MSKLAKWFSLLSLLLALALPAKAQFQGYTTPQTWQNKVMNAVTAPVTTPTGAAAQNCPAASGGTCAIANIGQTVHLLTYKLTTTVTLVQIRLEGSNDGTNFFPISDDATDAGQGQVLAIGYYPTIRANLVQCVGCGGAITLSASYTGTSATSGTPFGLYNPSQSLRKPELTQLSAGTSTGINGTVTPFGSTVGFLFVTSTAGFPSGSTVQVTAHVGEGAPFLVTFTLGTPSGVQIFPVPGVPSTTVDVNYASGGASASVYSVYYVFVPPQPPVSSNILPSVLIGTPQPTDCRANYCSYNPTQLGANAITLPASGTTALSNTVDLRGVKQLTFIINCTQNTNFQWELFDETGTDTGGSFATVNPLNAGLNTVSFGSESSPVTEGGTISTGIIRLPHRAAAWKWTNLTATAGTCTARLFVTY